MNIRAGGLMGLMGLVACALLEGRLASQEPKPSSTHLSAPAKVLWRYDTPRDFHLLEPAYRLPTPIKQALVQFVQPVPELSQAYATVFMDKRKFSLWFKGILLDRKKALAHDAEAGPTVLSSDLSKMSPSKGVITSTTKIHPRVAKEQGEIDQTLTALKVWDPE